MLDALLDPFRDALMQRALLEVVVLGAVCGPLGVWVVLLRRSYAAESFAHALFPGLVLAALVGAPLLAGAVGGALLGAGAIALAGRDRRVGADTGVAIAVSTLLGAGALLALSPAAPARVRELLFGDLLGTSPASLLATLALALVAALALLVAHRRLALVAFDRAGAIGLGARPGLVELTFLALLGLTIVVAVQALGNLLVVALLIAPATAATSLGGLRLRAALLAAGGLAALAGVLGLYASWYLGTATGASIALAALALAAIAALGRPQAPPGASRPRTAVEALGDPR